MLVIACLLIYLAVYKEFEPNLLLAIGFGMFIINIPGAYNILYGTYGYVFTNELTNTTLASGTVPELAAMAEKLIGEVPGIENYWINLSEAELVKQLSDYFVANDHMLLGNIENIVTSHEVVANFGLFFYLYKGIEWVIYPPLIFLGIGSMTDFGPMIANPKSMLMGAAAQVGIFVTFIIAIEIGFTGEQAAAIGIIGGADGPTAIYVTTKLAPELLASIAVAAYSYMALIKVIQPPIMKLLTTKKERGIVMEQLRPVSKTEKVIFPLVVTCIVGVLLPSAIPLLGMLMLGNLFRESGVVPRLTKTASNELINIVTILLGVLVGSKATASTFLTVQTLLIMAIGVFAFGVGTACGTLIGKLMSWLTKGKINPLIGAAGVSAVPMAARIAHNVGQEENPNNYLLMHAMGPNVSGVIGSAVAAGVLLSCFGVF
ncbi:MAG: sodium ion-translocating decarboxylase subunit beta [Clostridia bacterium]|nr:sodium ion-translocating decarboxylase subunit beta [Clostridia bacterium]